MGIFSPKHKKGEPGLYFAPYSNHFLGERPVHSYKKVDGFCFFPCKDEADAIRIAGDLLTEGKLEHQTAGILLFTSKGIEKITVQAIRKAMEEKK